MSGKRLLYLLLPAVLGSFILPRMVGAQAPPYLMQWGTIGAGNGQFDYPYDVAVDGSGYVYVVEWGNHRVQKFTSNGEYITQWGGLGAGNGQFDRPHGVAVDASGTVYVADTYNHRIQVFSSGGTYLTQWGTQGSGDGQFIGPKGIAVDGSGNVYVTDECRLRKFTSSGTFLTRIGMCGLQPGGLGSAYAVAADGSGNVYVTDLYEGWLSKFTSDGTFLTRWEVGASCGIAVDGRGNVWVSRGDDIVKVFTDAGAFLFQFGSEGSGDGQFNNQYGLDVAVNGLVYVADSTNHRVQVFGTGPVATRSTTWGRIKAAYR